MLDCLRNDPSFTYFYKSCYRFYNAITNKTYFLWWYLSYAQIRYFAVAANFLKPFRLLYMPKSSENTHFFNSIVNSDCQCSQIFTKFHLHNHLEGLSLTSSFTTVTESPIYIQLNLLTSFVTSTLQQTFLVSCGLKLPLEMCKNDELCSELHINEAQHWSKVACIQLSRKLTPERHTVLTGRRKKFANIFTIY